MRRGGSLLPDNEVDVDARVDSEVGDLLDHGGGAVDVNDSLVNSHLEAVPGVGTISARGATGSDGESLGRNTDGAASLIALLLRSVNDFGANVFQRLGLSSLEGHSDSLDFFLDLFSLGLVFLGVHFR